MKKCFQKTKICSNPNFSPHFRDAWKEITPHTSFFRSLYHSIVKKIGILFWLPSHWRKNTKKVRRSQTGSTSILCNYFRFKKATTTVQILWTVNTAAHQYNRNTWVQNVVKRNIFIQRSKKQNRSSIISGRGDWLIQEGTKLSSKNYA